MPTGFWIGRTGALMHVKSPALGMTRVPDRRSQVHQLLAGGARVDRAARTTRTWELAWPNLRAGDWDTLFALFDGQLGAGPYWLLDPTATNLLSPDQASAGNARGDLSSWIKPSTTETLALSPAVIDGAPVSLLWTVPIGTGDGLLQLRARGGDRFATMPDWVWSAWIRMRLPSGNTSSIETRLGMRWRDASGTVLSTTNGSSTIVTGADWTRTTVTATAPAGATDFELRLSLPAITSADPTVPIHIGKAQLAAGPDDPVWHPGQGFPRVSIAQMGDELPQPFLHRASWTLVEVG